MLPAFHARYSATARRYSYYIGTDDCARSPFRRRWEWSVEGAFDAGSLERCAASLAGEHVFRAFAVRGTAPEDDAHRCTITRAAWRERRGGYVFEIEANRFLHHMVRFLVGTMVEIARGRRAAADFAALLVAPDNSETSPPAPAHALFLDAVVYPQDLYMTRA
jgi:tRNA pseudouridine38-40 synthase